MKIALNFGYKLTYSWTFTNDIREMTRYSKISLKVDGDSFKIKEVLDADLFSYSNQYTKDY